MLKKNIVLSFLILLIPCKLSFAQTGPKIVFKELLQAQVTAGGTSLLSPFCGGINSTQPNHADLNNDGKKDLIIYDQNTETLKTFINIGLAGEERYRYTPKYAANFPPIRDYLKLIDYNCDNIPDLFHKGSAGVNVSVGSYNINNELVFSFYKELYFPGSNGPENAYVRPVDIPIIDDLDGDGDIDFASFASGNSFIYHYKNLQVEDNLPCDSIRIMLESPCFGSMSQSFFHRTHVLNQICKGGSTSNKKYRHAGNCILAIDINGNGLKDLVGGNISYNDAQVLFNGGTTSTTYFTSQDTLLDLDGHQLEIYSWPAPFYFDIDNDNDKDLVFTPHVDNASTANYNVMAVYENTGTTAAPNFVWRNDSALISSMIDVGRRSYPTLFDYDKDGKLDLFIGGAGYFNTITKTRTSQIAYYRNTSTVGNVAYELVTNDFLNLSSHNYSGIYPTFGDLTGDGVDDLILGNDSGYLALYNNLASSNATTPNFAWQTDSIPGIDVGNFSYPLVYDFNSDGKTDLLVGCEIGTLWLYEDTSATVTKELKRIDSAISNIKTGSIYEFFSHSIPAIGRVDSSNKEYLLIGTITGDIERYDSFVNQHTNWVRVDSNMGQIKTTFHAAPTSADLDGDQRPELLIGNQNGGLRLFQFVKNTNVGIPNTNKASVRISLYPNPTNGELWFKTDANQDYIKSYRILDISGRVILERNDKLKTNSSIPVSSLTKGLYFIEFVFENDKIAKGKFIKVD